MNVREGVRRLYLGVCGVLSVGVAVGFMFAVPGRENVEYRAANAVFEKAKIQALTTGDSSRYGSYLGWSDAQILLGFCPPKATLPTMTEVCDANRVTAGATLWVAVKYILSVLAGFAAFWVVALILLRIGSWIGKGFAGTQSKTSTT